MRLLRTLARRLYLQVLVGLVLGCAFGHFWPGPGVALKPVADAFIKLITMLIGPIIFCTIVHGIGTMTDLKKVGRVGAKALIYFEVLTTAALVIGLVVVNWVKPGAGVHANAAAMDARALGAYASRMPTVGAYLMNIIPTTFVGALTSGEILQVLLVAILFALALAALGDRGRAATHLVDIALRAFMGVLNIVMLTAPLAVFAAMAYTVGQLGLGSLASLAWLMACVYLTLVVFVVVVLGLVLRLNGIGLWRFLRYIRDELLIVLGTSSSEVALPGLMDKMENLGCAKPIVGLVVPAGYSFNLDGTCVYLTMAAVFVAQATDTHLGLAGQLGMLAVLLVASKGVAGVSGAGFVTLAATLAATHTVPLAGLTLILGIDRFLSQARALVNLIGNGVAAVTVAAWEKEFDRGRAARVLAGESLPPV